MSSSQYTCVFDLPKIILLISKEEINISTTVPNKSHIPGHNQFPHNIYHIPPSPVLTHTQNNLTFSVSVQIIGNNI